MLPMTGHARSHCRTLSLSLYATIAMYYHCWVLLLPCIIIIIIVIIITYVYIYIYIYILYLCIYLYVCIHVYVYADRPRRTPPCASTGKVEGTGEKGERPTPNLPTNIIPTKIAWLKLSGKSPMGLGIPPLKIKIMLESNSLNSIMLGRLAVPRCCLSYSSIQNLLAMCVMGPQGGKQNCPVSVGLQWVQLVAFLWGPKPHAHYQGVFSKSLAVARRYKSTAILRHTTIELWI